VQNKASLPKYLGQSLGKRRKLKMNTSFTN